MRKYLLALLGIAPLAVVAAPVQDDILETSAEGYLSRGVRMYETKNYTGCIDQLGEAKRLEAPASLYEDADFYIASAKFRRGDADCLKAMLAFVEDYPASIRRFQMWFNIGNYYYESGRYGDAVTAYRNVGKESFSGSDMDDMGGMKKRLSVSTISWDRGFWFWKKKTSARKMRRTISSTLM